MLETPEEKRKRRLEKKVLFTTDYLYLVLIIVIVHLLGKERSKAPEDRG